MKKPTRKALKKKCDTLFGKIVRSHGVCVRCGRKPPYQLQTSHFISRSYHATRFDFDNVVCLCHRCHRFFHENPYEHVHFMQDRLGDGKLMEMTLASRVVTKLDYDVILEELKARWDKIEAIRKAK